MIAVSKPYDEQPASGRQRHHVRPAGGDQGAGRRRPRRRARRPAAHCDGAPGQRMPTFYGAYFRDPDGNKVCVFNMLTARLSLPGGVALGW